MHEERSLLAQPRTASEEEIPILDLALTGDRPGLHAVAQQLKKAALGLGFFYIKNHGVSLETIEGTFAAARRYFDQPLDERLRCRLHPRTRRGFMPMGITKVGDNAPDLKESFDMGFDLPPDDPDFLAGKFMHGPNVWPEGMPWLREAMESYLDQTMDISRLLLKLFAVSLDVGEGYFLRYFIKPMMHTRLFYYPPQPPTSADDEFGVAPHADHGFITILSQDPIGGLEVRTRDGEWVGAPYIAGTFVVNLGNLFKRWTNDYYVSNLHRVINRAQVPRYSVATFLNLDYDTPVECIPSCHRPGEGPRYPVASAGSILEARLRQTEAKLERDV
jgi:isopenicillin N synthase-like dioxygenase